MNLSLPWYAQELFNPYRYKVLYGGRGGAKSETIGRALLTIGSQKRIRVLCGREFQNSISESVHKLLAEIIEQANLENYTVQHDKIIGDNGTEFIFKGVRHNVQSIKSMASIDILWLEEAHTVSKASWEVLIPTIRKPGSEIWVSYNPDLKTDPTHQMFVENEPPPGSFVLQVGWDDNPWFPEELRKEKDYLYKVDPESADHIWGGNCRTNSDAQVFKGKWIVEEFEPDDRDQRVWDGFYLGADWGFAKDPTTLIRMWLRPGEIGGKKLYIEHEAYGVGVDTLDLPEMFDRVPGARERMIRADNARPETISHMKNEGFIIEGSPKWSGSVEDGVEWLRGLEKIIIHPRCVRTIEEFKNYSYKKDRLTGDILPVIVDDHNHCIDAIRYGLNPMIQLSKNRKGSFTDEGKDYSDSLVSSSTNLDW